MEMLSEYYTSPGIDIDLWSVQAPINIDTVLVTDDICKTDNLTQLLNTLTFESTTDPNVTISNTIENIEKPQAPNLIYCGICMDSFEDTVNLNCIHKFCKDCVFKLLKFYIDSGNVSPRVAICPDCSEPIDKEYYQTLIGDNEELLNRYNYLWNKNKTNEIVASGVAVMCPAPDCPGYAYLIEDQNISACTSCYASICTLCKNGTHPGQTCAEYAEENKDENMDNLLRSRLWKRCPTCGVAVEREDGCNFMVCHSSFCQGAHAFCYACGKYLVEETYYMHFTSPEINDTNCNTLVGDGDHEYM